MKKGIIGSILAVALFSGFAYANTNAGTHGNQHMAAMHMMKESGKMMYDRDCPGMTDSKQKRGQDRPFAGTVTEDKLAEFEQEIMR